MPRSKFRVDFNEMPDRDLVLLSADDERLDAEGNSVLLKDGLQVSVFSEDFAEDGSRDDLIAEGIVERNHDSGWSSHVKWCCRISSDGIRHESEGRL